MNMKLLIGSVLGLFLAAVANVGVAAGSGIPMYITVAVNPVYKLAEEQPADGKQRYAVDYDVFEANTKSALDEAKNLGVKGIRVVFWWNDLFPDQNQLSEVAFNAYERYLKIATGDDYDFKVMVVLYGMPGWAEADYTAWRGDNQNVAFWTAFDSYVSTVCGELVKPIYKAMDPPTMPNFQIWNNGNDRRDPISFQDDADLILRAGYMLKSKNCTNKESYPNQRVIVNVNADVVGWEATMTKWLTQKIDLVMLDGDKELKKAGDYFNTIAINHDPTIRNLEIWVDWTPLRRLLRKINSPKGSWSGFYGAVVSTGYSTWQLLVANEATQVGWIDSSLPNLRRLSNTLMKRNPDWERGVELVGYDELYDTQNRTLLPRVEGHMGVIKKNGRRKLGFNALRRQVGKMQGQDQEAD